jgi:hypothetical protein
MAEAIYVPDPRGLGLSYPKSCRVARNLSQAIEDATNPDSFASLITWLKADSYVGVPDNTVIGGLGLEWEDQTGDGNDGTTGSGLVAFRTLGIGGAKPSVEIGGSTLVVPPLSFPGDFTIIVVAETLGDTSWLGNNAANVQIRRRRSGVNNASFFSGSGSEVISDGFASADAAVVMTVWRRSGTTVSFRENKTDRGSGTNGGAFVVNQIGASQFVGGIGDVGEIVPYTQALSDVALDLLYDNYFKNRWGLP